MIRQNYKKKGRYDGGETEDEDEASDSMFETQAAAATSSHKCEKCGHANPPASKQEGAGGSQEQKGAAA